MINKDDRHADIEGIYRAAGWRQTGPHTWTRDIKPGEPPGSVPPPPRNPPILARFLAWLRRIW